VTVGPDLTYNDTGSFEDAFVAKVNAAGTALDYAGYLGGAGDDYGEGIAVDGAGNAYVTGDTTSDETAGAFPVTGGPDLTYNGGTSYGDAFVAKVEEEYVPPTDLVLNGPVEGTTGATYIFTATVSPITATLPITYIWVATEQPPLTSTVSSLSHSASFGWAAPGLKTITVTAENVGGVVTVTQSLMLYTPVSADFTAMPVSGMAPLMVTFTNTSTGDYTASQWDFGDGLTSTVASPTHTFTTAGVYTISLTVSGPGGTDTRTRPAYITVTPAVSEYRLYVPLIRR
jgi:PKD repeat protein